MERFELCCARLHELTHIPLALCDSQGRYLAAWPAIPLDTILPQVAAYLPQDFLLQGRDALHPLIFYQEPGVFTGVVQLDQDTYCLAGPSSALQHSHQEVLAFCAPAVSSHRLQEYCSLLMAAPPDHPASDEGAALPSGAAGPRGGHRPGGGAFL